MSDMNQIPAVQTAKADLTNALKSAAQEMRGFVDQALSGAAAGEAKLSGDLRAAGEAILEAEVSAINPVAGQVLTSFVGMADAASGAVLTQLDDKAKAALVAFNARLDVYLNAA